MMSWLFGEASRRRRLWYERHRDRRRRLARPVISVGSLSIGGSGKTPTVAYLARLLVDAGERPSILSRGYGRRSAVDGVVVVSDGVRIQADVARAGDEPLMLARSVTGAPVLVSADRYVAGRLAERHLGCTVHLLDDGFQHLRLARDLDLVLLGRDDLRQGRPLPAGRLREPLETISRADAVVLDEAPDGDGAARAHTVGARLTFWSRRTQGSARLVEPFGWPVELQGVRVVALAAIARPERFLEDLERLGCILAGALRFRDHHPFSGRDVRRLVDAARDARAELVVTTEKDLMRLLPHRPLPVAVAWLPLSLTIEPAATFRKWLLHRLRGARPA